MDTAIVSTFNVHVEQIDGYEFETRFDKDHYASLRSDEPPPLGKDAAPNPARVLAAAVGECLTASFLFCAKRHGLVVGKIRSEIKVDIVRNATKRLRVGHIAVKIRPETDTTQPGFAECVSMFEDFCTVTQSVRQGIDVNVAVEPSPA